VANLVVLSFGTFSPSPLERKALSSCRFFDVMVDHFFRVKHVVNVVVYNFRIEL